MEYNERPDILRDADDIVTSLSVIIKNMQWVSKKDILPPYLVTLMSRSRQYLLKLFDKTTNLLIPRAECFVITLTRNTQTQI